MGHIVFGQHEARSLTSLIVDMVADEMARGYSEPEAIERVCEQIKDANQDDDSAAPILIDRALKRYVQHALRGREANGPTIATDTGSGKIRSAYLVASAPKPEAADILEEPLVQSRMKLWLMTFIESRLALANQARRAAAYQTRVDRLRVLIDEMERRVPDAATLGDAAERCGFTEELIDLSDVLEGHG